MIKKIKVRVTQGLVKVNSISELLVTSYIDGDEYMISFITADLSVKRCEVDYYLNNIEIEPPNAMLPHDEVNYKEAMAVGLVSSISFADDTVVLNAAVNRYTLRATVIPAKLYEQLKDSSKLKEIYRL